MQEAEKIWMNGELVDWPDATVHVLSHALHYGTSVFEGIRAYETDRGPAVFRLDDHLARLERSAQMYYMPLPYDREQLRDAVHELIRVNGLKSCYIRPIAFRGYGTMGLFPLDARVDVAIAVWEWGAYLGEESLTEGISAKISSWRRIGPNTVPATAKAGGQYLNSILAKIESHHSGYQEALLLNDAGFVADGTGENLFEAEIPRADLYVADEVFVSGTAAEVCPVRSVDDHEIGPRGPITTRLQERFFNAIVGKDSRSEEWLDYVNP